ncbi:hypothetical protein [Stomatohabitans albus]
MAAPDLPVEWNLGEMAVRVPLQTDSQPLAAQAVLAVYTDLALKLADWAFVGTSNQIENQ